MERNGDDKALTGSAPATGGAVEAAIADARRFAGISGMSEPQRNRFLIVVEEIVANILAHGRPPADSRIDYSFAAEESGVAFSVSDRGRPFDPRDDRGTAEYVPGEDPPVGGVGLRLIRAWCRITDYRREQGANRLYLFLPAP